MRAATLTLLGLLAAAAPCLAATPQDHGAGGPRAGQAAAPAARLAVRAPQAARTTQAARWEPRRRGQAVHGARSAMHWSSGLSPALGAQAAACPAGTMALLATGHSDVIRCMPI